MPDLHRQLGVHLSQQIALGKYHRIQYIKKQTTYVGFTSSWRASLRGTLVLHSFVSVHQTHLGSVPEDRKGGKIVQNRA